MGFWPALRPGIGETFPSVADALATGCVLAGLRVWLSRFPAWNRFVESPLFWLAPLAVAASARNPSAKLDWLVGQTVMNVGIAVIIERVVRTPGHLARVQVTDGAFRSILDKTVRRPNLLVDILNVRPLVFIGTLSYSLYLWQQMFLYRRGSSDLQSFPLNLLLAGLAALASYCVVERPFLRLRARLERRSLAHAKPAMPASAG
jgi:peptidoglycan/LPS O-acetylase OafA/YrhL